MQAGGFLNYRLKSCWPKRIYLYVNQRNLKEDIKRKTGVNQNSGGPWPTQTPKNRHCSDKVQVAVLQDHNQATSR